MKNKAFEQSKYQNWIDPKEVIPYERNAKIHDERQIKNIVNSIKRFGWQQDTVITSDNVLVIGHGRRLAALEIGCEMPYHRIEKTADELTDEDIRELRIADNQTNSETGYDYSMLDIEIEGLEFDGFDFDFDSGFDPSESATEHEERGSLADKYLIPPFSVIYANRPAWLARKRLWVEKGIRSELGRGGATCLQYTEQSAGKLPTGGGTEQSIQKQQQAERISKAKALSDGLITKREQIRKGTYCGNSLQKQGGN